MKKTTQTLDSRGNVTQIKLWNYYTGTPPVNPARTYNNTYLTSDTCNYASLYIFNRLTQSTLTDGTNTATLVTNQYGQITPADATGIREHDPNYNTAYVCRGNVTSSTTPSGTITTNYDIAGNVTQRYGNGELTTNTVSSSTNYAVPSAMTTISLTSTLNWTPFLAPSSATGPNGDSASISYDSIARPQSSVSPFGAAMFPCIIRPWASCPTAVTPFCSSAPCLSYWPCAALPAGLTSSGPGTAPSC